MTIRKQALPLIGIAALVTAMAGCAGPATPAETAGPSADAAAGDFCAEPLDGEKVVLTVSTLIEGFAPLVIAMQNGAFEDAGLDVSVEKIAAADSLAQIAQGRIDGQLTSYSVGNMNARAGGVDMLWVAPFYELPPAESVEGLPGYWARTEYVGTGSRPDLAGLEGQNIASPTGGTGAGGLVLAKALEPEGLTVDDITFTTAAGGDALVALENGAVAGAWLSAPFTQTASENDDLRLAATYEPGLNGSSLIVGPSLLDRPAVLTKLLQVLAVTNAEYLQGDYHQNEQVVEWLAAGLEQSPESIKAGVPFVFDASLDMADAATYVEELQEFMRSEGGLDYAQDLPGTDFVATDYAEDAAACLDE